MLGEQNMPSTSSRNKWIVLTLLCVALLTYVYRMYRKSGGSGKHQSPRGITNRSSSTERKKRKKTPKAEDIDDPNLPSFIMLMGISGSGKSTWAKDFVFKCDASYKLISSDDIRLQLTGSVDDQTKNAEVWEVVLNHVQSALKAKQNVILDATNTSTDKRRQFVRQLPPCNRYLKVFSIPKAIAKLRIAKDLEKRIVRAATPDAVIDVMQRQFTDSLTAVKDEGWKMK